MESIALFCVSFGVPGRKVQIGVHNCSQSWGPQNTAVSAQIVSPTPGVTKHLRCKSAIVYNTTVCRDTIVVNGRYHRYVIM